jgi:hypothetical protein
LYHFHTAGPKLHTAKCVPCNTQTATQWLHIFSYWTSETCWCKNCKSAWRFITLFVRILQTDCIFRHFKPLNGFRSLGKPYHKRNWAVNFFIRNLFKFYNVTVLIVGL